jgi:hypothetical protein
MIYYPLIARQFNVGAAGSGKVSAQSSDKAGRMQKAGAKTNDAA